MTTAPARPAPAAAERPRLLRSAYRVPTVGIVLAITLTALENISVASVMPTVARSLHGLPLYAWGFTAFLVAMLVGTVDTGQRCDTGRRGGRVVRAFRIGVAAFATGLVVAGTAPTMPVFILGRAVTGYGAGALIVVVYVVVGRSFPESLRPAAFSATAAAWVVPALVGPAAAGALTGAFGWRWVFLGLLPAVLLVSLLLEPALRRVPPNDADPAIRGGSRQRGYAVLLALGVALLQAATTSPWWAALPLVVVAVALGARPLRRLLPPGTLRARAGLPAGIALRGVLAGALFGAEAYVPLTLAEVHHQSPAFAGLPLTVGAIGWAAGSWVQGHRSAGVSRARLVGLGFGLLAVGTVVLAPVGLPGVPWEVAIGAWTITCVGAGLTMPSISVLTLGAAPEGEQGATSAALQITDLSGSVITIAAAGALIAAVRSSTGTITPAVIAVDLTMAALGLVGVRLARRLR